MRIGWDISHLEFTIEDHYYFSILKDVLLRYAVIEEVDSLEQIVEYDVFVINYPEEPFSDSDINIIGHFLRGGGRVIMLGYYRNEDSVADNINTLSERFGIRINADLVIDEKNNHGGDKLFIVTSRIHQYDRSVRRVLMPCTASLSMLDDRCNIIVRGEDTARTSSGNEPILAASSTVGRGEIIVVGTCVFWDNYSIEKYDNLTFALNLLLGRK